MANNPGVQIAVAEADGDAYSIFQAQYHDDPAAFICDCINWRDDSPAAYQLSAARELVEQGREGLRGPHGLGKTALAAWLVHWFALTRDGNADWKIPITASAWRQLTKFLWPEIHKWSRRLRWGIIGRGPYNTRTELLTLSLRLATGEAFALASNQADLIEGAHAEELLYVFDEAKSIPDATWNSAEGAFSIGECYWIAISTPGTPSGRFYQIHKRAAGYEDWNARHITLQNAIDAGRLSEEWAVQRKAQWGEKSAVYQNRVLGEFAADEEDGVIPLSWIELANERWLAWDEAGRPGEFKGVGVDVGRGGDKSVYALRWGEAIEELRRDNLRDTMAVAGKVAGILTAHGGKAIVDVIGVGAGVVDRLREQKFRVGAFNAGEQTGRTDRSRELGFVDRRSAALWNLREMLDPSNGHEVALPQDDLLTGDLTAPTWRMMSGGKIKVEAKDAIKKRIHRSTDSGDAVMQVFDFQKRGVFIG